MSEFEPQAETPIHQISDAEMREYQSLKKRQDNIRERELQQQKQQNDMSDPPDLKGKVPNWGGRLLYRIELFLKGRFIRDYKYTIIGLVIIVVIHSLGLDDHIKSKFWGDFWKMIEIFTVGSVAFGAMLFAKATIFDKFVTRREFLEGQKQWEEEAIARWEDDGPFTMIDTMMNRNAAIGATGSLIAYAIIIFAVTLVLWM